LSDEFEKGSFLNVLRLKIAKFLFHQHPDIRAVSERIKASIYKKMAFPANAFPRVEVFPVYMDRERFKNAQDTVHLKEKYPGYDLIVLVVARLEPEKNVDLAIRLIAIAKKRKQEADICLVIVGDGSEKEKLKAKASTLGIADRVFFEGAVADPAPYYKSADVLLVTSHYEGYGRMIAEATAAGCLVITRDVGAARELVSRSSGIVCAENDQECLLHNLLLLGDNRLIKEQLVSSAHIAAERAVYQSKEQYLEQYKKLLEKATLNDEFLPFA